ncbi:c-type cytochrome [Tropicibacter oceani]|uniref:Cytochrome c n=1 Tax=Tropicibacter oceani TaxID=3058420 RepID=A0ABY8QGF5_9RHOB|nr:cytochrome c [Tropicibacter oceani]WGW03704.1 cytochrome c [Tropicibacter oceani]
MVRISMALLALAAGCNPQPDDPVSGRALYDGYCVKCHGERGLGDGPMAAELPIAVADLSMLRESNGGVFPYEAVMTQIYGYPGRYHQGLMPEFGPVLEGQQIDWVSPSGQVVSTPRALVELVDYLEHLQQ